MLYFIIISALFILALVWDEIIIAKVFNKKKLINENELSFKHFRTHYIKILIIDCAIYVLTLLVNIIAKVNMMHVLSMVVGMTIPSIMLGGLIFGIPTLTTLHRAGIDNERIRLSVFKWNCLISYVFCLILGNFIVCLLWYFNIPFFN